ACLAFLLGPLAGLGAGEEQIWPELGAPTRFRGFVFSLQELNASNHQVFTGGSWTRLRTPSPLGWAPDPRPPEAAPAFEALAPLRGPGPMRLATARPEDRARAGLLEALAFGWGLPVFVQVEGEPPFHGRRPAFRVEGDRLVPTGEEGVVPPRQVVLWR